MFLCIRSPKALSIFDSISNIYKNKYVPLEECVPLPPRQYPG